MKPLTPTTPHVIILIGIPGAGKTHFGEHFAKTFQAPFINHRAYQELTGTDESTAIQLTGHLLDEFLKTQRTFVFEGPTHQQAFRQGLVQKLTKAGFSPLLVWVQTETNEAKRRALKTRPDLDDMTYETLLDQFQAPTLKEKVVVISGRHTFASQVKQVLKNLSSPRGDRGINTPPPRPSQPKPPQPNRNIIVR